MFGARNWKKGITMNTDSSVTQIKKKFVDRLEVVKQSRKRNKYSWLLKRFV